MSGGAKNPEPLVISYSHTRERASKLHIQSEKRQKATKGNVCETRITSLKFEGENVS